VRHRRVHDVCFSPQYEESHPSTIRSVGLADDRDQFQVLHRRWPWRESRGQERPAIRALKEAVAALGQALWARHYLYPVDPLHAKHCAYASATSAARNGNRILPGNSTGWSFFSMIVTPSHFKAPLATSFPV